MPEGRIALRAAHAGDIPLLLRWDGQPHVRRAITGDPDIDPGHDWAAALVPAAHVRHLLATLDGRPFAYLEVIEPARDPERHWGPDMPPDCRAIDIWIGEKDDLGKGYGTQAMRRVIDDCFSDPGVDRLFLDPRPDNTAAQAFFRRLGFRFDGQRQLGDGDWAHVHRLDRADWHPSA